MYSQVDFRLPISAVSFKTIFFYRIDLLRLLSDWADLRLQSGNLFPGSARYLTEQDNSSAAGMLQAQREV